ncbi:MAG: MFS transporter [Spirochaetes bacterium GWD1_61_31]|nr:MAG: MFS transporter [Spirochaetes bacterium GWB1_60_80]OHD29427.1 MAG: MFS transporter [Spirochaetes bacterium GWC1_61_12]OHD35434.1 MAG: MFS transporter [Spirochaetes bacterium GWD1_61_31]OHD44943.1 MAG: MFS transporter [Spirochaetes bacterium GWE1_60_18]OHD60053.1 MAG: MFS transporter [Spirochaetes bacterium GWF1_60_12]HAP43613.1 MFS transporter [Spirochaetaceae bacterium]
MSSTNGKTVNRWLIAIMGTVLQICLGTIYAWSFFQNPLMRFAGWNNQQVAMILSLALCFLGLSAAVGGTLLPKMGPRKLAVSGAILYALGWALGGLALTIKSLPLLYIGLGVIGGIGLGLGYVTPVATAAKWFPDKKGFITGMVVMGFGLGALFMSKVIAPSYQAMFTVGDSTNWPMVFFCIAGTLGVPALIAALTLRNPPAGYVPAGWTPPAAEAKANAAPDLKLKECISSTRFWFVWVVFFCNITAGLMFIGFQSPMLQNLLKLSDPNLLPAALAAAGATLIAISSLFNGIGRFFWGGLSDKIGRANTYRIILGSQILIFIALIFVKSPILFAVLVCYILLCYGGGFGTAPSYVLTVFGNKIMGVVYGCLLTAWSMAGLVGPQVAAMIKDRAADPTKAATTTYIVGAIFLGVGFLVALLLHNKPFEQKKKA